MDQTVGSEFAQIVGELVARILSGGELVQSSNVYGGSTAGGSLPKPGTYARYEGGGGWTDYRVRVRLRSLDDDAIGLMFRVQGVDDYYRFSWDLQRNYQRLVKKVGGQFTLLAEQTVGYVPGQAYEVEVTAEGSLLEVRVDGVLVLSASDGDIGSGTVALYVWANAGSYFDDVSVEQM